MNESPVNTCHSKYPIVLPKTSELCFTHLSATAQTAMVVVKCFHGTRRHCIQNESLSCDNMDILKGFQGVVFRRMQQ